MSNDFSNEGITVVIPTLDREGFLMNTIADLLAQTHRPMEILVVDQSAEVSPQLLAFVQAYSEVVSYHRVPFRGSAKARNYGWQHARYDAVVLMLGFVAWALITDLSIDIRYGYKDRRSYHLPRGNPGLRQVGRRAGMRPLFGSYPSRPSTRRLYTLIFRLTELSKRARLLRMGLRLKCKIHGIPLVCYCPACRGSVRSERKAQSSKENGKLGGRPPKAKKGEKR